MPITPYTGPFGEAELRHLLRRALFGCSPADMAYFSGMSLNQVVDALLTYTTQPAPPIKAYTEDVGNGPDPSAVDPDVPFGSTWVNTVRDTNAAVDPTSPRILSFMFWRTGLMVHQERNLREKLTLFWFNHMPVQVFTVFDSELLYQYDMLLRTHSMGNFRQLIEEVTRHGAMLDFLNGRYNTVASPDENYARELFELFTLGVGSGYTQDDVQSAARVLTGWKIRRQLNGQPVIAYTAFVPADHDTGNKTFSAFFNNTVIQGVAGATGGQDELTALLEMIFAKEEVSRFIVRQLYRWFVHGDIDAAVEADVIEPLAQLFRDNASAPDQMRTVVHALLTSAHFFGPDVRNCMVRSPADLLVGHLRSLGMPFPTAAQFEAQYSMWADVYWAVGYAGQDLCAPPNVAGWGAYYQFPQFDNLWVDTALLPNRTGVLSWWTYGGPATDGTPYQTQSQNLEISVDFVALVGQFADPADPNALVDEACRLLYGAGVSQTVKDQLKTDYLLQGQQSDYYWTSAYNLYIIDPNNADPAAQMVPDILRWMFGEMINAAEIHLH